MTNWKSISVNPNYHRLWHQEAIKSLPPITYGKCYFDYSNKLDSFITGTKNSYSFHSTV